MDLFSEVAKHFNRADGDTAYEQARIDRFDRIAANLRAALTDGVMNSKARTAVQVALALAEWQDVPDVTV